MVIGKDAETGEKNLLGLTVNKEWRETAKQVKTQADILVADADKPLRSVLLDKALNYQLCIRHAVKQVGFHLWKAGLPRNERREILGRLRAILHTCRNSVHKHLKDGDTKRLQWRINKALADLDELAKELVEDGLMGAAKFLRNSANYLVTFARLAVNGIEAPYTNNLIERLMGEIAKRVKNKWMHWSTQELENLLNVLLVRYRKRQVFNEVKEKYSSQGSKPLIKITIT